MVRHTFLFIVLVGVLTTAVFSSSFGHGVGYETLPPQTLGDKEVAMEVNSKTDNTGKRQLNFFLVDTSTGITLRDVKYQIKMMKNGDTLFERIHDSNNGILTLELIPDESEKITTNEKSQDNILDLLLGTKNDILEARGKIFRDGGLYKFSIKILEAEGYSGKTDPVTFESGISFPDYTEIVVNDAHFGRQTITQVSYYDTITNLSYDAKAKSILFSMPFEWTMPNINQTSVVHQEVIIPKTFGTLQVSEYAVTVNGVLLSNQTITVDDFPKDNRIVHILLYQNDLEKLYEKRGNDDRMDFALFPKSDDVLLVGTTDNIQYKIAVSTVPKHVTAGSETTILFQIYDIFLLGKTVSVSYDVEIESNGTVFYKTSGTSTDEKTKWNKIALTIPRDASNKITLHFENLGGNGLARTEIPIALSPQDAIPSWIKENAELWCKKSISDGEFLGGIEYLIDDQVIAAQRSERDSGSKEIRQWVRSIACWWSDGSISDAEFTNAIAFLVKNGIITL